jgi:glycosyltransferase involved in cell wall biosynthesis
MLAHNDERTIGDSLGRIRPYVREALVLDLGSTDRSRPIALEYGARLYGGTFADDLGSLRNALLGRATSEWILCLDADEMLSEPQVEKTAAVLRSVAADVWGVRMRVRGGRDTALPGDGQVRLFRNRNQIVFQFRIGELLDGTIAGLGGRVIDSDIELVRVGAPEAAACYRSARTRLKLLHLDLAEHPEHPSVLFCLAEHHFRSGDFFHAECYWNDCLEHSSPPQHHYRAAALGLIESHLRKGDPWRAAETAEYVLKQLPDDAPFRAAVGRLVPSAGKAEEQLPRPGLPVGRQVLRGGMG